MNISEVKAAAQFKAAEGLWQTQPLVHDLSYYLVQGESILGCLFLSGMQAKNGLYISEWSKKKKNWKDYTFLSHKNDKKFNFQCP